MSKFIVLHVYRRSIECWERILQNVDCIDNVQVGNMDIEKDGHIVCEDATLVTMRNGSTFVVRESFEDIRDKLT